MGPGIDYLLMNKGGNKIQWMKMNVLERCSLVNEGEKIISAKKIAKRADGGKNPGIQKSRVHG